MKFDIFLCQTACRQGFFGKNCSHTCIKTCNGCNNVNGLCDSGCLLGWKGYFCSEIYGNIYSSTAVLLQGLSYTLLYRLQCDSATDR